MLQDLYGCKNLSARELSEPLVIWECVRMTEQQVHRTFQGRLKRFAQCCVTAVEHWRATQSCLSNLLLVTLPGLGHMDRPNPSS